MLWGIAGVLGYWVIPHPAGAGYSVGGFVNAGPGFADHPQVVNGASDLMVAVLGDAGRHARFAVGASSLPMNVAVEIDAIFEIS